MKKEWIQEKIEYVNRYYKELEEKELNENQKEVIMQNIKDIIKCINESMECYNKLNRNGLITDKTLHKYMDLSQMFYDETYELRKSINLI